MGLPDKSVALSAEQIADLNKKLSVMRHNVNNHLALIVAASELIRRKPEMSQRLIENIIQQPERIIAELRAFSTDFENALGVAREQTSFITTNSLPSQ
jgi:hypothetical protein